ncbi:MAG: hypothetical protein CL917_03445 [Deltaproteobacteria bacterium]|nr:hypothetical protein [Deltaproteobacteria bacterium]
MESPPVMSVSKSGVVIAGVENGVTGDPVGLRASLMMGVEERVGRLWTHSFFHAERGGPGSSQKGFLDWAAGFAPVRPQRF